MKEEITKEIEFFRTLLNSFLLSLALQALSSSLSHSQVLSDEESWSSIYRREFGLETKFWVFNFEKFWIHFHVYGAWSPQKVNFILLVFFLSFSITILLSHGVAFESWWKTKTTIHFLFIIIYIFKILNFDVKITIDDYSFSFLLINSIDLNYNWDLGNNFFFLG